MCFFTLFSFLLEEIEKMVFDQNKAIAASVLLWEEMKFLWTLSTFFKPEYEVGTGFKIPYMFIIDYLRDYRHKVSIYCGAGPYCQDTVECPGHRFLHFLETVEKAIYHGVENEKVLFRFWFFDNLKFKKEATKNGIRRDELYLYKWDFIPIDPRDLKDKTYSQRVSLLR